MFRVLPSDVPREMLATGLATGDVSSVEVVDAALERISQLDGGFDGLRAVISLSPHAREAARQSDARRSAGEPRSALDGVPFLVKDCMETYDTPTTHGSALFRGWSSRADAGSVRAMRRAGAVMLGKASLDDFAAATVGMSSLRGTMPNPADRTRTVGGSSGGSASAVAAGYVPFALGTDTGGSLRIPAAACGVTTIRPTPGTVATDGIFPRSLGQDAVGPIAGSVADVATCLDVLRGSVGRQDFHRLAPVAQRAGRHPRRELRGLRIGLVRGLTWGDDVDGPVLALVERAADLLADAGARVVDAAAPSQELLEASALVTSESAAAVDAYLAARPSAPVATFAELVATRQFGAEVAVAFERERALHNGDWQGARHRALTQRAALRDWTRREWETQRLDVVLYPTTRGVAGPIGALPHGVFTRWSEEADLPALALPVGAVEVAGGASLPASAEMLAAPFGEELLVRVAASLEALLAES